jgi:Tfp pilus assembly protein PilO
MSSSLDKLNLRPGEKRLLVVIGIVLFIVLNVMFVQPRFGEFGKLRRESEELENEMAKFQREIDKQPIYEKTLREMEGQGSRIVRKEQSLRMLETVQSQALASGVSLTSTRHLAGSGFNTSTNAFFDEQSLNVTYDTAGYRQLTSFLVSLAEHEAMIRVRHMDVKPSPNQQRLQGSITLVASFQRDRPNQPGAATPAGNTASNP